MAAAYQAFIDRWPHFKADKPAEQAARQALIESELGYASKQVNVEYWGEQTTDAVMLLAAHRIATQPGGQFSRLQNKSGGTAYLEEYTRMEKRLLIGDRVF
ncbi:MAG TPA: hypothetical protein VGO53_16110 [Steroidobacteraceae bacterium]|jgi:hypothetical protein|nr:hypothetical protein [Steroidobacteraceae bacterium]